MTYEIPAIPPSNNRFIGRTNYREYQRIKKQWAELIAFLCRPRPKEPLSGVTVKISYYFPDNRRRDCDNYSGKMILDGLVKAEIIKDDSFQVISLLLDACFGSKDAKTVIEIEEGVFF